MMDSSPLRLGILGLSEGNGHPYSWSAIFNGYNPSVMAECPFPLIPDYLSRQKFPESRILEGKVTCIWTQNRAVSEHVARASLINTIVDSYEDMIGQVDAVLLARDDAETHLEMSRPFLRAGLPVYIDKPIAYDLETLSSIYSEELHPGQIFTCSALRYSNELKLTPALDARIGTIRHIQARTPKDWRKYAIHIIEPVLALLDPDEDPLSLHASSNGDTRSLDVTWKTGTTSRFETLGPSSEPISIRLEGTRGCETLVFKDTFSAFRSALQAFVDTIKGTRPPDDRAFIEKTIRLVEAGL